MPFLRSMDFRRKQESRLWIWECERNIMLGRWIRWGHRSMWVGSFVLSVFLVEFDLMGVSSWTDQVIIRGAVDEDDMTCCSTGPKRLKTRWKAAKKKNKNTPQQIHRIPVIGELDIAVVACFAYDAFVLITQSSLSLLSPLPISKNNKPTLLQGCSTRTMAVTSKAAFLISSFPFDT